MPALPRGVRNLNPGNIRRSKIKWKGKVENPTDPDFEQFVSAEMGIRAIARDLLTGYKRGEDTVEEIITAWAPQAENDTRAYVAAICKALGCRPDQQIDVDDYSVMAPLVKAIIKHENGQQPYTDEQIRTALFDAGVDGTPGKAPAATVEGRGAQATAAGAGGTAVIEAVYDAADKLEPFKPMLESLAPTLTVAKYALLLLTLIGAGLVAYGLFQKYRTALA